MCSLQILFLLLDRARTSGTWISLICILFGHNNMNIFLFLVRNAGNVIPHAEHFQDEYFSCEPAALELSCVVNNIRHIIVCGHSDCKAMNLLYTLRDPENATIVCAFFFYVAHFLILIIIIYIGLSTYITVKSVVMRTRHFKFESFSCVERGWHAGTDEVFVGNADATIYRLHWSGQ